MKIHFVWPISVNFDMVSMSKILIKSAEGMNCYFTIMVQKEEYGKATKYFKNIAEVLPYSASPKFAEPWVWTPKWDIEPKGDIVLGLDSDVVIFNQKILLDFIKKSYEKKIIYGTIAYESPFSHDIWENLFNKYEMKDSFKYEFLKTNTPAPYYINNGVVIMPNDFIDVFRFYHKKWLFELNNNFYNLFYISQVATTFAIKESKLPHQNANRYLNYLESSHIHAENFDYNNIAIFHYNESKYCLSNLEKIKINFLKEKLIQLSSKIKIL